MDQSRATTQPSPRQSPPSQAILGWRIDGQPTRIGFSKDPQTTQNAEWDPVPDAGEGHLMTIAPTGAGKGRSVIIPTLLSYEGPVIVIDPKGENHEVTARRRKEMGQEVIRLDPFNVTGWSHCFNVLDTFDIEAPDSYDAAMALAELIAPDKAVNDPFWENSARHLIATLILHVAAARPPVLRNLSEVIYLLNQSMEDMGFTLKEMQKCKHELVRRLGAGFMGTEPKVWVSILSTARTAARIFNSQCFADMDGRTEIPLEGIVRGDPISIYLILPPEKLDSHGRLLRLWIGCLMDQICKRRHQVEKPTLFILDEAAQLGTLQQLRRAITLLRGYGVRTWSFWQDLSQLQHLYPDWQTLYNNTRYIQTFGATTHLLAESLAHLLRLPGNIDPLTLPPDQMVLAEARTNPRTVGKPDYLKDPHFKGLYDQNPFFQPARPHESKLAIQRRRCPEPPADEKKPSTVLTLQQLLNDDYKFE